MKIMQIMRNRHVFAVPRCPPASHEDLQPPDPLNTPAHIPPSPPSHNRPGDYDNNDYYLYHDDGNDNNDDDDDDDDAGDDDDDQRRHPRTHSTPNRPHTTAALTRASSFSFSTTI